MPGFKWFFPIAVALLFVVLGLIVRQLGWLFPDKRVSTPTSSSQATATIPTDLKQTSENQSVSPYSTKTHRATWTALSTQIVNTVTPTKFHTTVPPATQAPVYEKTSTKTPTPKIPTSTFTPAYITTTKPPIVITTVVPSYTNTATHFSSPTYTPRPTNTQRPSRTPVSPTYAPSPTSEYPLLPSQIPTNTPSDPADTLIPTDGYFPTYPPTKTPKL